MKEYTGDRIRNVAIVGHGGAGTTSVTEALLYRSGAISRMCKVEDGATTTDSVSYTHLTLPTNSLV